MRILAKPSFPSIPPFPFEHFTLAGGAALNSINFMGGLRFAPFEKGGLFFLLRFRLCTPISFFVSPVVRTGDRCDYRWRVVLLGEKNLSHLRRCGILEEDSTQRLWVELRRDL